MNTKKNKPKNENEKVYLTFTKTQADSLNRISNNLKCSLWYMIYNSSDEDEQQSNFEGALFIKM